MIAKRGAIGTGSRCATNVLPNVLDVARIGRQNSVLIIGGAPVIKQISVPGAYMRDDCSTLIRVSFHRLGVFGETGVQKSARFFRAGFSTIPGLHPYARQFGHKNRPMVLAAQANTRVHPKNSDYTSGVFARLNHERQEKIPTC